MDFTRKPLLLIVVVLLLAALAGAQAPCRPTAANPCPSVPTPTPYSTAQFSVTFNGPVETWSEPNTQKTSVDVFYASKANGIEQTVAYRTVHGEIDVDTASLDFYVKALMKKGQTLKSRQDGTRNGHIFTYFEVESADETPRLRRNWLTIQNSHTLFVLMQSTIKGVDDSDEWNAFVKSFAIKE